MSLTLSDYDLPDAHLFSGQIQGVQVWQPDRCLIVLGQSNSISTSLCTEAVAADGIMVTKRPSGGEAVILTPATIAYTIAKRFPVMVPFREFFSLVNSSVIEGLRSLGVDGLGMKGISDITIGNLKIAGSSMRKINDMLIYHAVLNLAEEPATMERYLRHPVREPDYRTGRSHHQFVTSLLAEGYRLNPEMVTEMLYTVLTRLISQRV